MIHESLSARSYRFAILFGGHPQMKREDNLKFYDNLTAQGIDLPIFEQKTNEIILQNVGAGDPRNILRVTVGHFGDKFRLFILEDFPTRSMEIFLETADNAWKVFSEVWHPPAQALALAEVTLQYTASVKGGNATQYLLRTCLKIPNEAVARLERKLAGIGLRLISPVEVIADEVAKKPPLVNADFNAHIETLLEDPSLLYIQVTTKWPSLPLPAARGATEMKGLPSFLNPECHEPSWYLKEVQSFITNQLLQFLQSAGI